MKKATLLVIATITTLTFAQNARLDAMAGVSTQGDFSTALKKAADIIDYKDQAQMSAGGSQGGYLDSTNGNYYNFIATKSIGRNVVIGATVNTAADYSDYYSAAFNYATAQSIDTTYSPSIDHNKYLPYPNLLAAFQLGDNFVLGAELFYDINKADSTNETDTIKLKGVESISQMGFNVTANLGEDFKVSPYFGMAFPMLNTYYEVEENGNIIENTTKKNRSAIEMNAGADLSFPVGKVDMQVNAHWNMLKYQFQTDSSVTAIDSTPAVDTTIVSPNKTVNNSFNLLYGVTGTMFDKLLWVIEYRGSYDISRLKNEDKNTNPVTKIYTDTTKGMHNEFALAFERPVKGFWIFDGLIPRAGFLYVAGANKTKVNHKTDPKSTIQTFQNYSNGMNLTTGFGLTKGRATIDIAANFSNWDASFTGPTTASATLTVNFGKNFKSQKNKNLDEEQNNTPKVEPINNESFNY